jgi:hypothetical protein
LALLVISIPFLVGFCIQLYSKVNVQLGSPEFINSSIYYVR